MPVNLIQYRGAIGIFSQKYYVCNAKRKYSQFEKATFCYSENNLLSFVFLLVAFFILICKIYSSPRKVYVLLFLFRCIFSNLSFFYLFLLQCGDIEINPGPKPNSKQSFSICHWNLNGITAHNYAKVFLLKAYVTIHKFDVVCISETYLDPSTPSNDDNLEITGYTLVRSDHPSKTKGGRVCIYYKNYLPLKIVNINYLNECIRFEIKIGNKLCSFIILYRSPSQSQDEFETFLDNLELNLESSLQTNPFVVTVLGDFNAKLNNWFQHDHSTPEGISIDNIVTQYGLHQVINEPTHILETSSSCIDLIFTSQPNLIAESVFILPYIQIAIIRLFLQNLI